MAEYIFTIVTACLLLLTGADGLFMPRNAEQETERCNTETRELDLVRQVSVNYQGSMITVNCVGTITANECEGACLSKVSPSVHRYPDFEKVCSCCREGALRSRTISLTECYQGNDIIPGVQATAHIQEPINCSCQTCRN